MRRNASGKSPPPAGQRNWPTSTAAGGSTNGRLAGAEQPFRRPAPAAAKQRPRGTATPAELARCGASRDWPPSRCATSSPSCWARCLLAAVFAAVAACIGPMLLGSAARVRTLGHVPVAGDGRHARQLGDPRAGEVRRGQAGRPGADAGHAARSRCRWSASRPGFWATSLLLKSPGWGEPIDAGRRLDVARNAGLAERPATA